MTKIDDAKLKEILLAGSYLTKEDVAKAEEVVRSGGSDFKGYLLGNNLLTKDLLGQAIAEGFKVPYADLNTDEPSKENVLKIPEDVATKFKTVLFKEDEKSVIVATDDPLRSDIMPALKVVFPQKAIKLVYSLTEDIENSFIHYQKPLETRFSKIIAGQKRVAPEILEEIFRDAIVFKASDIHFEPRKKEVLVRFRIDGVLQKAGSLPKDYYDNVLNRIKVQAALRIDKHLDAQDGSMRYEKPNTIIDFRVSIVPTVQGEKIVLRVLASYLESLSLPNLGLSPNGQQVLGEAIKKPFGMIIVTGPTGSGKTTTLYSLLKILNNPTVNITTIEDPVEYKMVGANQIQVNRETELTFAKGLRSIVRQDPDIILVGEIRDRETSEIAVNAALTGHLLLSTFHANDASTAIPRLLDMGNEPFLLASTLEVIVAQRLVRKICENCRYSVKLSPEEFPLPNPEKYFGPGEITIYKGKKCEECNSTGYKGRTAIFEFIDVTPQMQNLILENPSSRQIWQLAKSEGSQSMFIDGIEKVKNGITTVEELLRVAEPPYENQEGKKQ